MAIATGRLESFKLAELAQNGVQSAHFRAALKRDHAAIVELPEGDRPEIAAMWSYAAKFFALSAETKNAMGPLDEPEFSEDHLGQPRLLGFTQMSANDCLDTRLRRRPPSDAAVRGTLEILPRQLEASLPGATQAIVKAQQVLFGVGMTALRVVIDGLDGEPLALLESTSESICCCSNSLPEGATSATVHRFVRYAANGEEACEEDEPIKHQPPVATKEMSSSAELAFPAHTDGTWFTVIPCAAQLGLEVHAGSGWLSLEAEGRHGVDVAVLTGQFLESLSKFEYAAASHRVVRPKLGEPARLSAPLLMRAAASYRDQCKQAHTRKQIRGYPGGTAVAGSHADPRVDSAGRPEGNVNFKD